MDVTFWGTRGSVACASPGSNPAENQIKFFAKNRLFAAPFFPVPFEKIPSKIDFKEHSLGINFSLDQDIVYRHKL